jgi:hypothetical protein
MEVANARIEAVLFENLKNIGFQTCADIDFRQWHLAQPPTR